MQESRSEAPDRASPRVVSLQIVSTMFFRTTEQQQHSFVLKTIHPASRQGVLTLARYCVKALTHLLGQTLLGAAQIGNGTQM